MNNDDEDDDDEWKMGLFTRPQLCRKSSYIAPDSFLGGFSYYFHHHHKIIPSALFLSTEEDNKGEKNGYTYAHDGGDGGG